MIATPTQKITLLTSFSQIEPSLLDRWEIIPGISDHEVVLININMEPYGSRPIKRKMMLWKKADFNKRNGLMKDFCSKFMNQFSVFSPVEEMWQSLRSD